MDERETARAFFFRYRGHCGRASLNPSLRAARSVGSLKALRAAKASEAPEPFAGFGNPLLTGADGTDKSTWAKQDCSEAGAAKAKPHREPRSEHRLAIPGRRSQR